HHPLPRQPRTTLFPYTTLFRSQQRQAIPQTEVFAVAGGVLADERDLAHARARQPLRLGDHRFKAPRAEFAAKLRNDAESARVVADRKSTRLNSSHSQSSYAVFC